MHACLSRRNPFAARMVIGFGLILLGTAFILRNLGALPAGGALRFWPLLLVLLALASFVRRSFLNFGGHLLLLAAVALQLKSLGHADLLAQWWPLGLIWLGSVKVARSLFFRKRRDEAPSERRS